MNANENVKMNVLTTINALLLLDKKDTISKKLSGGMKRKLSIGIALVGDSKVVKRTASDSDAQMISIDFYCEVVIWQL